MNERYTSEGNTLAEKNPDIARLWHPSKNGNLRPEDIAPKSNKKVWWMCDEKHEYLRSVDKQIVSGGICPVCNGRLLVTGVNDISTKYPNVAEDWDYEANAPKRPEDYSFVSATKVSWKCKTCGFKWKATVKSRCVRGNGCHNCAGQKRWEKRFEKMNLGITDSALLEEWDYELNKKGLNATLRRVEQRFIGIVPNVDTVI